MGIVNRVKDLINKIKGKIITSNLAEDNRGMGVIEVILIIVEIFIFNISVYNVSIV